MTVTPERKKNSAVWNIIKIILALVLVGFVLSRTDLDQFLSLLKTISIPWLVGNVALYLSLTFIKAVQYYYLNARQVSFPRVLNVVVMQNAVTNYFASTAGIASYLAVFRAEHGVKVSRSAIIFILTKIGDLLIIWVTLCISSILVWQTIEVFHSLILALVLGVGAVLLVFFLTVLYRQRFVSLLIKLMNAMGLLRISFIQKGVGTLETLSETEFRKVAKTLGVAFLLSAVYFVASVAWIYASFMTLNFQQDLRAVVFVSVVLQLISYVPIQVFGGLGITETGVLYFWSPFDMSQTELASVMLGIRVLFYVMNLLPLIYLPVYTFFFASKNNLSE